MRKNVIYERARFNKRDQLEGETAEEYITTLYSLVKTCNYKADLVDEMLRDRLVAGIRDKPLSDKLQMKADLTLESAKKAIRQREAVREQRHELGNDSRKVHPAVEDVTRRFIPKPTRDWGGVSPIARHTSKERDKTTETRVRDVAGEMPCPGSDLPQVQPERPLQSTVFI